MIVYVDLIFLTNFFFDASLLMMTAFVRKIKIRRSRLAAAALCGALYAAAMIVPRLSWLYAPPAKLVFSLLIVGAAFGFGSLPHYVRNACAFFVVHFAAAGALFAAQLMLLSADDVLARLILNPSGRTAFAFESGLWLSFPVFLLSLWLLRSVFESAKRTEALQRFVADVRVEIGGHSRHCRGLIDTGNQLYDPLTRVPVMIMESGVWKGLLPDSWLSRIGEGRIESIVADLGEAGLDAGAGEGDADSPAESFDWRDRLRFVPYRGVNRGTSLMLAFKPDKVEVTLPDKTVESRRVLVALDGGKLSAAGTYRAIVHPMLLEP